jgi:hypothetical protein
MYPDPFSYKKYLFSWLLFIAFGPVFSQDSKDFLNTTFLQKLNNDSSYLELKKKVVKEFAHARPGRWGEFVTDVGEDLNTRQKDIAFTFDACGGKNGNS